MTKENGRGRSVNDVINKAKDNSYKLIFDEPELFIEFLRDFVRLDIFNDITPNDIEDITERFIPLFIENKDADTVKKINLKGNHSLFVIAILEHESKVNYRCSFKMLLYIALVLDAYEKEVNAMKDKASFAKEFKFPPILPIVFYDGVSEWTAERNFLDKTELSDIFYKYIPKFEYELVDLNQYKAEDLVLFGDTLSFIMLIDKIKTKDGMSLLSKLPDEYKEKLSLNIPPHLNKLIADVITILLSKIRVPNEEIEAITDKIYERSVYDMFEFLEDYDVQETRRIARQDGLQEGRQEGRQEGFLDGLKQAAKDMLSAGFSTENVAKVLKLPLEDVVNIQGQ